MTSLSPSPLLCIPYSISVQNKLGQAKAILSGSVRARPGLESQNPGKLGFKIESPEVVPKPRGRPAYLKHENQA